MVKNIPVYAHIECRGRNGWFDLKQVITHGFEPQEYPDGVISCHIDFFSKKRGKNAPIVFRGEKKEIKRLLRYIADRLEG